MELDTGASFSLISETVYHNTWSNGNAPTLRQSTVRLHTYTGEELEVLGTLDITVQYKTQQEVLPLLVVRGQGPSLFGRNWLQKIKLDWTEINYVTSPRACHDVLEKHPAVFRDELGMLQGMKAKIHVHPQAQPKFFRPRSVPYVLREKVEKELDRLEKEGIIAPVQFSDWAAPI